MCVCMVVSVFRLKVMRLLGFNRPLAYSYLTSTFSDEQE